MSSKLHLNISGKPACGRQFNNHRKARAQLQDRVVLAPSFEIFQLALGLKKACRHCGRVVGLIPPVRRRAYDPEAADLELTDEELLEALSEDGDSES